MQRLKREFKNDPNFFNKQREIRDKKDRQKQAIGRAMAEMKGQDKLIIKTEQIHKQAEKILGKRFPKSLTTKAVKGDH